MHITKFFDSIILEETWSHILEPELSREPQTIIFGMLLQRYSVFRKLDAGALKSENLPLIGLNGEWRPTKK
jgi:hypothetical protein